MKDYEARSDKATGRMKSIIDIHILPALGKIQVEKVTRARIRDWHRALAAAPRRLRTKEGEKQQFKELGDDPNSIRKRKATANKALTTLKAALNHAFAEGDVADTVAWTAVRPFKNVDAPKVRYLSDDESLRLTNSCADDLRQIVTAALLTGCRYGELARLKCGDFDPDSDTLYMATSKSGKPRHIVLTDEGSEFFTQATAGRAGNDLMFARTSGSAWGNAHQYRPLQEACEKAKITPPASFHILRHSYASRLAMNGVPMKVIAEQLGHVDTRITEKHYAHLADSYKADTVRAAFGSLGRHGNVGDIGCHFGPNRNFGHRFHPSSDLFHDCGVLAHRCAHLALGQPMRTGKVELEGIHSGSLSAFSNFHPALLFILLHA